MITSERMQEIMREVVNGIEPDGDTPEEAVFRKNVEKDVEYFKKVGDKQDKPVEFNWTQEIPD